MSRWSAVKNYINSKEIGDIIWRGDLLLKAYGTTKVNSGFMTTVDNYRSALAHVGVLVTVDRGFYMIKAHINESTTTTELYKAAFSHDYRQWFHDIIKHE